jgi:hypothetical protein
MLRALQRHINGKSQIGVSGDLLPQRRGMQLGCRGKTILEKKTKDSV